MRDKIFKLREKSLALCMRPYELNSSDDNSVHLVSDALAGVSANLFFDVVQQSGFTAQKLAGLFHTSLKTLQRYFKDNKRLDPAASEHLLRVNYVYRQGKDVFGSVSSFEQWLEQPAFGLGGNIPFKLLETPAGVALVSDELSRISFGDLS